MRRERKMLIAAAAMLGAGLAMGQQPAAEAAALPSEPKRATSFVVTMDPVLQPEAYNGRVYVVLAKSGTPEPRLKMGDWFDGPQVFVTDLVNFSPVLNVVLGEGALGFPKEYGQVPGGTYTVQAVARRAYDSPSPGKGEGDLYSEPLLVNFEAGAGGAGGTSVELKLSKAVGAEPFKETERVKLVEILSPSLSEFYGRPVKVRAGVCLPAGWKDDPSARHPTVYFITGFGGDHRTVMAVPRMMGKMAERAIVVVPDPTCYLGHSVFADSENNGPRGRALMEELIPEVERRYHGARGGKDRYVTGISSGGWGSLWLQVAYPEEFNGVWSHCPDPVDFRDFQRINLYAPGTNMYRDEKGQRRPLARRVGEDKSDVPFLWYDDFVRQETVLGPGGQIHSFEAVFSPRGADGKPVALFDRETGEVDEATAKAWEKYDLRLVMERNWASLGPKLKGKLHIYAGEKDTFYLDGAARLLFESLRKLGSDAEMLIVPGMGHTIYRKGMESMFAQISPAVAEEKPAEAKELAPAGAK